MNPWGYLIYAESKNVLRFSIMGPVFKLVQIVVQNLTLFDINKNWIPGVLWYAEPKHVLNFWF